MTNEYITVWQSFGAGIGLVASSLFYSLGGRSGKWYRRWIASFIISATVLTLCFLRGNFNPWQLLIWPIISIGYHLGYGGNEFFEKIWKRFYVASAIMLSSIIMAVVLQNYWILPIHFGVGFWSIYLGVRNPIEAASEEFFISMLLNIGLVMYPFVS